MNNLYLNPAGKFFLHAITAIALITFQLKPIPIHAQGLVFKNAALVSGIAGTNGAVYRFSNVTTNVDALVTISARSSSLATLSDLDLTGTGWNKAFQPQVNYFNDNTSGKNEWWMEFDISFVSPNTGTPVIVSDFDLTAIDIDGNGNRIREWVALYGLKSYTVESNSSLTVSDETEMVNGKQTVTGKRFEGPNTKYDDVDTNATRVMVTARYENKSQFRIRTGGTSNGNNIDADRMYSFWFKSFLYQTPVQGTLPVTLSSFTAKKADTRVLLNWTTEVEKNVSHFVIERSINGADFTDAGIIFTDGNTDTRRDYSFTDDVKNVTAALLYYRLKIVDMDGVYKQSVVRIIKLTDSKDAAVRMIVYPNPVINEVRVTLPLLWQDKPVTIQVINSNGTEVKKLVTSRAGQTEIVGIGNLPAGLYIVKASNGREVAVQQLIKAK